MNSEPTYIIDAGQERESLAAWRVFTGRMAGECMCHSGIAWPAAWCLMRLTKPEKLPGEDDAIFAGDIDVLVGRLLSEPTISAMSKEERRQCFFRHSMNGRRFFDPEGTELI